MRSTRTFLAVLAFKFVFLSTNFRLASSQLNTVALLPTQCGQTSSGIPAQIVLAQTGVGSGTSNYTDAIAECRYVMQAQQTSERLSFGFGTGDGEVNAIIHSDGCSGANATLYDSDGTTALFSGICGVLGRTQYQSTSNLLTLVLQSTGGAGTVINFTAHYTSFFLASNCSSISGRFPCTNGRCIDSSAQCDPGPIDNCGDFSDNSEGPPGNCSDPTTTAATTTTVSTPTDQSTADLSWLPWLAVGLTAPLLLYWWLLMKTSRLLWILPCWRVVRCFKLCCCSPTTHGGKCTNCFQCCCKHNDLTPLTKTNNGANAVTTKNGIPTNGVTPVTSTQTISNGNGIVSQPGFGSIRREPHIFSPPKSPPPVQKTDCNAPAFLTSIRREPHVFSLSKV